MISFCLMGCRFKNETGARNLIVVLANKKRPDGGLDVKKWIDRLLVVTAMLLAEGKSEEVGPAFILLKNSSTLNGADKLYSRTDINKLYERDPLIVSLSGNAFNSPP